MIGAVQCVWYCNAKFWDSLIIKIKDCSRNVHIKGSQFLLLTLHRFSYKRSVGTWIFLLVFRRGLANVWNNRSVFARAGTLWVDCRHSAGERCNQTLLLPVIITHLYLFVNAIQRPHHQSFWIFAGSWNGWYEFVIDDLPKVPNTQMPRLALVKIGMKIRIVRAAGWNWNWYLIV